MRIDVLCVGKLKERYFRQAADEYLGRIRRYCDAGEIEIAETPEAIGHRGGAAAGAYDKETAGLIAALRKGDYVLALCVDGAPYSSEDLAALLGRLRGDGSVKRLVCIIGGSTGVGDAVIRRADMRISMSAMTFPHRLARVMLMEQLYRACTICAHEKYHK